MEGGVAYLHAKGITHRDVKLENLLLADVCDLSTVKLVDFGMAKAFDPTDDPNRMALVCGTPAYIAPEVVTGRRYTNAVDCWSCGVILYILLSGVVPFKDPDEHTLLVNIARGAYSVSGRQWVLVSESAKSIVTGLMRMNPDTRLTAAGALVHPWMAHGEAATPATALPGAQGGLRAFAERAKLPVRSYAPSATVFKQGDPATEVLLIRRGHCDIVLEDVRLSGGGDHVIATRGPGEFIGEMGLLLDQDGQLVLPLAECGGTKSQTSRVVWHKKSKRQAKRMTGRRVAEPRQSVHMTTARAKRALERTRAGRQTRVTVTTKSSSVGVGCR